VAQRVNVILVCDRPGQGHDETNPGDDVETVPFAIDGHEYEMELCGPDAEALRKSVTEFAGAARSASRVGRPARRVASRTVPERGRSLLVRAWAKERGYKVNERGRVPATITAEYEAAHP
jgi:nucleoid-associated protein Lsr2